MVPRGESEVSRAIRQAFLITPADDEAWDEWRLDGLSFDTMISSSETNAASVGLMMIEMLRCHSTESFDDYFFRRTVQFLCPLNPERLQRGRLWRSGELNPDSIRSHLTSAREGWVDRDAEERLSRISGDQASAILLWLTFISHWPEATDPILDANVVGAVAYWSERAATGSRDPGVHEEPGARRKKRNQTNRTREN